MTKEFTGVAKRGEPQQYKCFTCRKFCNPDKNHECKDCADTRDTVVKTEPQITLVRKPTTNPNGVKFVALTHEPVTITYETPTGTHTETCHPYTNEPTESVRHFDSGATRDTDENKYDFEGFLSPLVVSEFAKYMHKHRLQSDGSLRSSDNWQKGIPLDAYMKSGWRHFMDWWVLHRGHKAVRPETDDNPNLVETLCGLLFNIQGYLHETLNQKDSRKGSDV